MSRLLHVVDWTNRPIKIEAYPLPGRFGWNPYAAFTVYPANNIAVKNNVGTLTDKGTITKLVSESVSISRRLTPASMKIDSLVSSAGILFDENDNLITPSFSVNSGLLECNADCTGTVIIEYNATVRLFEYTAEVINNGTGTKAGVVWAYDENAPKNITTYEIPLNNFESTEQARFARVYREILVADKRYEMPTTFQGGNISYASYPGADVSELDADTRKDELTQEELLWDGFTVQNRDRYTKDWCYPVVDDVAGFLDVQWKFSEEIPQELVGNTQLTDAITALKTKYGIV